MAREQVVNEHPYRSGLLFCEGLNCIQGDQSGILSIWHNAGRLLHKTIARSFVYQISWPDHEL